MHLERRELAGLHELKALIQKRGTDRCLLYGIPANGADSIALVTERAWEPADQPGNVIPRTGRDDHDPPEGGQRLGREELVAEFVRMSGLDDAAI